MNGHLLLATSLNPTKSSCNRQEEGKVGLGSYGYIVL